MHKTKSKNRKLRYTFQNELDEYSDNTIRYKQLDTENEYENNTKHRRRRHTEDEYENNVKHKRRRNVNSEKEYENKYDTYDEKHIVIKKNNDSVQKEVIIKKYTKIHPTISNDITENNNENSEYDNSNIIETVKTSKLLPIISKLIVKLLCYFGIFTCAAL